jgi:hypothetical protein
LAGGAEKLVGKVTKNPELMERGQERKVGLFSVSAPQFLSLNSFIT